MATARFFNATWFIVYARWAQTPAEAREAMAALPKYSPLPASGTSPWDKGHEGRVRALVGDADGAVPLLRAAIAWCGGVPDDQEPKAFDSTTDAMRDRLLLGQILEQKGDAAGACEQYGGVLARWGSAKPRSVTDDAARARSKALGCR